MSVGKQLVNLDERIAALEAAIGSTKSTTDSVSFDMAALKAAVDEQVSASLESAKSEAVISSKLTIDAALVELRQIIQDSILAQVHTFVNQRLDSIRLELLDEISAKVVVPPAPAPVPAPVVEEPEDEEEDA